MLSLSLYIYKCLCTYTYERHPQQYILYKGMSTTIYVDWFTYMTLRHMTRIWCIYKRRSRCGPFAFMFPVEIICAVCSQCIYKNIRKYKHSVIYWNYSLLYYLYPYYVVDLNYQFYTLYSRCYTYYKYVTYILWILIFNFIWFFEILVKLTMRWL